MSRMLVVFCVRIVGLRVLRVIMGRRRLRRPACWRRSGRVLAVPGMIVVPGMCHWLSGQCFILL